MHRDQRLGSVRKIDQAAAVPVDRGNLAKHALRRGRAHRHHQFGVDRGQFALVPWPARHDLRRIRLLVQADFSARHKFEMLHRVGDVNLAAIDAGLLQRAVEHLPGGPDERFAGEVFLVAGLLADQHDAGPLRAFAEYGPGRVFPQWTGVAIGGQFA
jgi:hypothetical protein